MSKFCASQLDVELVKNRIISHALVDLAFEFFNLNSDLADVLLGVSKLIDGLGDFVDFLGDFSELSRYFVSFVLGLRLDKFDFFVSNLLILSSVEVSDVLAIDLEHAHDN